MEHGEYGFGKDHGLVRCYCTVPSIKVSGGKSWRPTSYGKTKREAREKLEKKLEAKEKSLVVVESKETLEGAIKAYNALTALTKKNAASTVEYLNRVLRCQVAPYELAKLRVEEVGHAEILEFFRELSEAGVSDAMQKKAYNVLTGFFTEYYKAKPYENPAFGLKFGGGIKKVEVAQIMDDAELQRYFGACEEALKEYLPSGGKNPQYEPHADLLEILVLTYMRSGEALVLTYEDWAENSEVLSIKKTLSRSAEGKTIVGKSTKTKSSMRELKVSEKITAILSVREAEAIQAGRWAKKAFIWQSEASMYEPMSRTALKNLNQRIMKRAGVGKHIRIHDLRHTGISYFLRHGSSLALVSKRAGHSKQSITADIYTHVLESDLSLQAQKENEVSSMLMKL